MLGMLGTRMWPASSRLPNMLHFTDPPTVTVSVGDPLRTKAASHHADTKKTARLQQ